MLFARQLSFFIVTVYVPCSMTVSVSWMSFWLDHKAVRGPGDINTIIIINIPLWDPRLQRPICDNPILTHDAQLSRFPPGLLSGWRLCWRCPPPRPASRTPCPPWPTPRPSTSGPGSVSSLCLVLSWSTRWSTMPRGMSIFCLFTKTISISTQQSSPLTQ